MIRPARGPRPALRIRAVPTHRTPSDLVQNNLPKKTPLQKTDVVQNNLPKKTPLQKTFSGNFLALFGGGTAPVRFTLRAH